MSTLLLLTNALQASTEVLPSAVSLDCAMLGYGIGTGPPGVGVLQTSGNAIVVPLLLW